MKEVDKEGWNVGLPNQSAEDVKKAKQREEQFTTIGKFQSYPSGHEVIVKRMGFDLFKGDKENG